MPAGYDGIHHNQIADSHTIISRHKPYVGKGRSNTQDLQAQECQNRLRTTKPRATMSDE